MRMQSFALLLALLLLLAGCLQEEPQTSEPDTELTDTIAPPADTVPAEPSSTARVDTAARLPSAWAGMETIPKQWIKLERDKKGYLVYTPCNGETPRISLDSNYVTIYWQLDAPTKLVVNKFIGMKGGRSFFIDAADEYKTMELTAEIKDARRKLVLWTFGDMKWVMTPLEFRNDFRQVSNPCPGERKPEKQFLPVEY